MANRNDKGHFLPDHGIPGPGRETLYDASMNEQVTKLALLGMTDEEMAKFFGVTTQTFYNWQKEHIAFFEAVQAGKIKADAEVVHSLYRKATGITYEVERIRKNQDGESEIIKLQVYEPPDTPSMKMWLSNRQRNRWSERLDISNQDGSLNPTTVVLAAEPLKHDNSDD